MVPAFVGVALNWLPFKMPGWLAAQISRTADEPATYKLLAALLTFPLFWSLEVATACALRRTAVGRCATALAAPATGYAALRRCSRAAGPADAAPTSMEHERLLAELRAHRARLRDALLDATRPSAAR